MFVRTLYYVARARTDRDAVIRQMYEIGNRSVFLLTVVIGFIGMIFVLQAGLQMQRVIPDLTMLGASFLELLVRDLAPSIVALRPFLRAARTSGKPEARCTRRVRSLSSRGGAVDFVEVLDITSPFPIPPLEASDAADRPVQVSRRNRGGASCASGRP